MWFGCTLFSDYMCIQTIKAGNIGSMNLLVYAALNEFTICTFVFFLAAKILIVNTQDR